MKPSADKDIKKYAETVQKLRENRNRSDDEFALLMGCSGTLRGDETAQEKSGTAASEQEVDISETDRILYVGNIAFDISGISTKVPHENMWLSHFCSYVKHSSTRAFPRSIDHP